MIQELINERERQEEEKLMQAIRQNYRDTRMERKMNEQLKAIKEQAKEKSFNKYCRILLTLLIVGLTCSIMVVSIWG